MRPLWALAQKIDVLMIQFVSPGAQLGSRVSFGSYGVVGGAAITITYDTQNKRDIKVKIRKYFFFIFWKY